MQRVGFVSCDVLGRGGGEGCGTTAYAPASRRSASRQNCDQDSNRSDSPLGHDESYHLIDAKALALMKPDAYLIVVSRGGIVDEDALAAALKAGKLGGAGLDVTEVEPLAPDSPLWDAPNVVITPHTAGDSTEKELRCIDILRENLRRYAHGETLLNLVDKKRGY